MSRKIIALFMISSLLTIGLTTTYAAKPIEIRIEDEFIKMDVSPIVDQGRVLVPIRIMEALGAKVSWDQKTKTATIKKWSESVQLTVGKKTAVIQGSLYYIDPVPLDVSVINRNKRVYVPLRFISQIFGYRVDWKNNKVSINSPLTSAQKDTLYNGSLEEARKLVIKLGQSVRYEIPPLDIPYRTFYYSYEYLFPEGEALRFYRVEGGKSIALVEFKGDFPVVVWEGLLDGDYIQGLYENKLKDQTGPLPKINKTMFYYGSGMSMMSSWMSSGQVDVNGKYTMIGTRNMSGSSVDYAKGEIFFRLPNEKRKEVVVTTNQGPEPNNSNQDQAQDILLPIQVRSMKNVTVLEHFSLYLKNDSFGDDVQIITSHDENHPEVFSAPVYLLYKITGEQQYHILELDVPPMDLTKDNLNIRVVYLDNDYIPEIIYSIDVPRLEHVERWPHILQYRNDAFVDTDITSQYNLILADWDITIQDGRQLLVLYEKKGVNDTPIPKYYKLLPSGKLEQVSTK